MDYIMYIYIKDLMYTNIILGSIVDMSIHIEDEIRHPKYCFNSYWPAVVALGS